jgi:CHASE1-domain containing sensor protein
MDATKIARLENEADELAMRLARDVDLFSKGGSSTQ